MEISEKDFLKAVDSATEKATKNVLLQMGIDTSDPLETQADMRFTRKQRLASIEVEKKLRGGLYVALIAGAIALFMLGLEETIKGWIRK